MIKHGMDVERQAIEFLNPGQIPITTFDQPLFALAKFVQWRWPDTHGEKVHVVMLGGRNGTLEYTLGCLGGFRLDYGPHTGGCSILRHG